MSQFKPALETILQHEGGYVNDPTDTGGETFKGISRNNWPDWLGWQILDQFKKIPTFPPDDTNPHEIQILNQLNFEVEQFYFNEFWQPTQASAINDQQVATSIFDFAINAGIQTAIKLAQQAAGATPDGKQGPNTLQAINATPPQQFIQAYTIQKIKRYIDICNKRPANKKYFFGWVIRAIN